MVLAQTGRTVSLVAKYRPPMPVLAVVIPTLQASQGLSWKLEGKLLARQCLTMRGVKPIMAAPMGSSGDELLSATVQLANSDGLVKPLDYVVVIMSQNESLVVKVLQVNDEGTGISKIMKSEQTKFDAQPARFRKDPFDVGSPTHPPFLSRTSMSLAGAGTFGANLVGGGLVQTASDMPVNTMR